MSGQVVKASVRRTVRKQFVSTIRFKSLLNLITRLLVVDSSGIYVGSKIAAAQSLNIDRVSLVRQPRWCSHIVQRGAPRDDFGL